MKKRLRAYLTRALDPTPFDAPKLFAIHIRNDNSRALDGEPLDKETLVYASSRANLWRWIHTTSAMYEWRYELQTAITDMEETLVPKRCSPELWASMNAADSEQHPLDTMIGKYYFYERYNRMAFDDDLDLHIKEVTPYDAG